LVASSGGTPPYAVLGGVLFAPVANASRPSQSAQEHDDVIFIEREDARAAERLTEIARLINVKFNDRRAVAPSPVDLDLALPDDLIQRASFPTGSSRHAEPAPTLPMR